LRSLDGIRRALDETINAVLGHVADGADSLDIVLGGEPIVLGSEPAFTPDSIGTEQFSGAPKIVAEMAAIANQELLRLQEDLTDAEHRQANGHGDIALALERTYLRLAEWRHGAAIEAQHLGRSERRVDVADLAPEGTAQVQPNVVRLPNGQQLALWRRIADGLVVSTAHADLQWLVHDAALTQLADLLIRVRTGVVEPTVFTEDFANAAYLLWQAPLDLAEVETEGADQVITTFLVTAAKFLFAVPLQLPQDVAAKARTLPQLDGPTGPGFVSWLAARLPRMDPT
jgi:hypothetical protein